LTGGRLDVRLLGPVEVLADGRPLELGGPQPRAVVAHLALDHGRVVSVERLVARLWGDDPPAAPLASLQTTLSRLRRVLEPDRAPGAPPGVIASEAPGYVLRLPPGAVDLARFRQLALDGRRAAAGALHGDARRHFEAALAEWRGTALGGIGPDEVVAPIAVALDEERLAVIQDRFEVLLALGLHVEAVADLSVAVSEHPLREGLWSALAIALYRSQRQADALRAIDQARRTLIDELGLDPGPGLRDLERRILDHDPSLLAVPLPSVPAVPAALQPRAAVARFVGRDTEWTSLLDALARAGHGDPRFVLLEGDAGIGKSSIAERLLAHAAEHGWRTAVGRGVDGDLAPALWPMIELVRAIGGELAGFEPGQGPTMHTPVELADQALGVLDREASGTGWCLLIDDLHWADPRTLAALGYLRRRGGGRRTALVTSVASEISSDAIRSVRPDVLIRLEPLSPDDLAPLGIPGLHEKSGGNPRFVTETLRCGKEPGPSRALVEALIAQCRAEGAWSFRILTAASLLEQPFEPELLAHMLAIDPATLTEELERLCERRMLRVEGLRFRFRYELVRRVLLDSISPARRRLLRQRFNNGAGGITNLPSYATDLEAAER